MHSAERPCMRKVRAPQGRIADNVRRRRLSGQVQQRYTAAPGAVRVERRGKSPPVPQVTAGPCKLYPEQHRRGDSAFGCRACPARFRQGGWRRAATCVPDRWLSQTEPGLQACSSIGKGNASCIPFSYGLYESCGLFPAHWIRPAHSWQRAHRACAKTKRATASHRGRIL